MWMHIERQVPEEDSPRLAEDGEVGSLPPDTIGWERRLPHQVRSCAAWVGLTLLVAAWAITEAVAAPVFSTTTGRGVTNDLFDVAQGTRVVFSTPQHTGNSDPRMALGFGALPPWGEPGTAIFADGPGPGYVDSLTWQTPGPVNLVRIRLWLAQDGPGNPNHGASEFRLLGSQDGVVFTPLSQGLIPLRNGANVNAPLLITDNALTGVTNDLRVFRLELTRLTTSGPRLIEIDGFGTPGVVVSPFLDRLAFNAASNQLRGRGTAATDDEGPGLASDFAVSSRLSGTDSVEDAFGNANGLIEPDTFIFGDGGVPDNGNLVLGDGGETVDFIEWITLAPVTLAGYRLELRSDGAGGRRGTELVRFVVDGVERDLWDNNSSSGPVTRLLPAGAVTGERFRLEFTRTTEAGGRVVEMDAITGPLPPPMTNGVVLNEVAAVNTLTLDEDGDSPAWIELMNASEEAVDLAGWGVSDNPKQSFKWRFPYVVILPHAYLVVFASGKDRTNVTGRLHTDFKIDAGGEEIRLARPDGTLVDAAPAARLRRDVSLARSPNASGPWKYFGTPTPGRSNNTKESYDSLLFEPPAFSAGSGFFANAFALSLSAAETGAEVRFTLDGSEPTLDSPVITAPLAIASRAGQSNVLSMIRGTATVNQHTDGWKPPVGEVRKATVVRARAFRSGALPGPVATHTYFVGADAVRADSLPVLSIVTPTNGLFDYYTGIYMLGAVFDQYVAANPGVALTGHTPANYTQRGSAWERAADLEFFEPGGVPGWSEPVGLDIQGQSTRSFRQKSFGLKARGEEGKANTIEYPLFPGLRKLGDGLPLTDFPHLRLRNAGNDWDVAMMRDDWCHRLAGGLGLDLMSSRPTAIYLDGEYWGLLTFREQQDPQYLHEHYGIDPNEAVILYAEGGLEEGQAGDDRVYRDLRTFASTHDLADATNYDYVRRRLDVDDFLIYQLAEIYFANADWPQNNTRIWRRRLTVPDPTLPRGQDGRWRFFLFDVDLGVAHPWSAGYTEDTLSVALSPSGRPGTDSPWATAFLRALMRNPGFKRDFLNAGADLMNSWFKAARAVALVDAMETELRPAMAEHIRRWQSCGGSLAAWQQRVQVMRDFAQNRTYYVRQYLAALAPAGTATLTVNVAHPEAGTLRVNRLTLSTNLPGITTPLFPWRGVYFRNNPITLEAIPAAGYRFVGWTSLATTNPLTTVTLTNGLTVQPEFAAVSQDLTTLALTEIDYHPPARDGVDGDRFEFLELQNSGPLPLDLSGLAFTAGVSFAFTNGTTLAPGAFLVLASSQSNFATRYPNVAVQGEFTGKLDNGGEMLMLGYPGGRTLFSLTYDDALPWPNGADGGGLSLQRVNRLPACQDPANWCAAPPTPGADAPASYRDSDGDGMPDFWEIANRLNPLNASDATQDADGDGLTNLREFTAGTDPHDAGSTLRIETVRLDPGGTAFVFTFTARSNKTCVVQCAGSLGAVTWTNLAMVPSLPAERPISITNAVGGAERFYRLVTPVSP